MATVVHRKHKQGSGHDDYHDVDLGGKEYETPEKGRKGSKRFDGKMFSLIAGVVVFVYYVYFGALRYTLRGWEGVYDIFWICNLALLIGSLGMILDRAVLIGTALALASFSHISWILELVRWLWFDQLLLGRLNYLVVAQYNHIWWTTLHHLWFVPLCLAVLHTDFRHHGVPFKAWINATILNVVVALAVRLFGTPNEHGIYKNYLTGHEFWDDSSSFTHYFDTAGVLPYLAWSVFAHSIVLNGVCFAFLKAISLLALEKLSLSKSDDIDEHKAM